MGWAHVSVGELRRTLAETRRVRARTPEPGARRVVMTARAAAAPPSKAKPVRTEPDFDDMLRRAKALHAKIDRHLAERKAARLMGGLGRPDARK